MCLLVAGTLVIIILSIVFSFFFNKDIYCEDSNNNTGRTQGTNKSGEPDIDFGYLNRLTVTIMFE